MEKIKQMVDEGQIQLAKLGDDNQPKQVPYQEIARSVDNQRRNVDILKLVAGLSWEEKYEWVNLKKLKAKEQFECGQYSQAMDMYIESLLGTDVSL
jgi:hypothetical protein